MDTYIVKVVPEPIFGVLGKGGARQWMSTRKELRYRVKLTNVHHQDHQSDYQQRKDRRAWVPHPLDLFEELLCLQVS